MKVKTKITSDFTNHSVNGCLKICVNVLMVYYLACGTS